MKNNNKYFLFESKLLILGLILLIVICSLLNFLNSPIFPDEIGERFLTGRYIQDHGFIIQKFMYICSSFNNKVVPLLFKFPAWFFSYLDINLSDMAMREFMKKSTSFKDYVPHGFRSTFRDWAAETTNYPNQTVELALAHTIKNKTEKAYRRMDQLDKRRNLMHDWEVFINKVI